MTIPRPKALDLCGKPTSKGAIRLADLFEKKGYAPVVNYQKPLFAPKITPPLRSAISNCLVPTLNWHREIPVGTPMTDLDANAAYVAAASSADFAHGWLTHWGYRDEFADIMPGYYLVDWHHWGRDRAPGSPLGAAHIDAERVWVTAPTYRLLRDLTRGCSWTEGGAWPDDTVYDSWTATVKCRFTDWTTAIRDIRTYAIETSDATLYKGVKLGYSQAVQMWSTPHDPKGTPKDKCEKLNIYYRPDWHQTLRAQHAMNLWRRAFIASEAGHPPVFLGGRDHLTDGLAFTTSDLTAALARTKPPFRIDPTRTSLGTFRVPQGGRYIAGDNESY